MPARTVPRAIPRSAVRQITPLKIRLTYCLKFTADSKFLGRECDPVHAWRAFEMEPKAKLRAKPGTTRDIYVVTVSREEWFELSDEKPPEHLPPLHRIPAGFEERAATPQEAAQSLAITIDNDPKSPYTTCTGAEPAGRSRKSSAYFFMEDDAGERFIVTVARNQGGTRSDHRGR
jgi:hypothetical protein